MTPRCAQQCRANTAEVAAGLPMVEGARADRRVLPQPGRAPDLLGVIDEPGASAPTVVEENEADGARMCES